MNGQDIPSRTLSYTEFLIYVKQYHPRAQQAKLILKAGEAELLKARGAFDPKLEIDFQQKKFKDKDYYSILNSSFKIPTWYGIDVKANFDTAEGEYVNPQNTTGQNGLKSLGIAIPLGQGLWINQRMSDLQKAKTIVRRSKAEQELAILQLLFDASSAYFDWLKAYNELTLYKTYESFAQIRYNGIAKLIESGDKAAIDSVEAGITIKNRVISIEQAQLKLAKAALNLSTFLWINDVPVELQDGIVPDSQIRQTIEADLPLELISNSTIEEHPKIRALQNKLEFLTIDNKLKANSLLPKLDIGYYYLSESANFENDNLDDYKIALNFSFSLFLRKERAELALAKLKRRDSQLDLDFERLQLNQKVIYAKAEVLGLKRQLIVSESLVNSYSQMLSAEERMSDFGESSIFLINIRENNLIGSQISQIELENKYLTSHANLFRIIGKVSTEK